MYNIYTRAARWDRVEAAHLLLEAHAQVYIIIIIIIILIIPFIQAAHLLHIYCSRPTLRYIISYHVDR
jgi:hypothetical protein